MIKNINARTGRICVGNAQNPESASLGGTNLYAYAYDAVGNRVSATETTNSYSYTANALNQYTSIIGNNDGTFIPEYDDDGNQTLVKTETGVWRVSYNGENRPVAWSNGTTVVEMSYDDTGRRRAKRVVSPGSEVLHTFLYDGYLLVAESAVSNGVPLTSVNYVWDPSEGTATRALCTLSGTNLWFHTHDLTKNVWELLDKAGGIKGRQSYLPFGGGISRIHIVGNISFSSEYSDLETGLSAFTYRCYWGYGGRWISRDPLDDVGQITYLYLENRPVSFYDLLGLAPCECSQEAINKTIGELLYSAKLQAINNKNYSKEINDWYYPETCGIVCCDTNTGQIAFQGPRLGHFRDEYGNYRDTPPGTPTCGKVLSSLKCDSGQKLVAHAHTHPENTDNPCFSPGDRNWAKRTCVPLALRNISNKSPVIMCCPDGKCRQIDPVTWKTKEIPCPRRK